MNMRSRIAALTAVFALITLCLTAARAEIKQSKQRDNFQLAIMIFVEERTAVLEMARQRPELTVTHLRKSRRMQIEPWLHRLFWQELERIPPTHINGCGVTLEYTDGCSLRFSGTNSAGAFWFEGLNAVPRVVKRRLFPILQAIKPFAGPGESMFAKTFDPDLLYPLKPEEVWPGELTDMSEEHREQLRKRVKK